MNLETIETRLDELTQIRAQQIEELQKQIEAIKPIVSAAKAEMKKAFDVADMKAYYKAAGEFRAASEMLETYEKQMTRTSGSNIISHPEYEKLSAEIINYLDKLHVEAIQKILTLMDELKSIGDEVGQGVDHGSELLRLLEFMINPNSEPKVDYKYRLENNGFINISSSIDQVINMPGIKCLREE